VTDQTEQVLPASRQPVNPAVPDGVVNPKPAPPRTADQIEQDIEATRTRLSATIDEIGVRVKPENLVQHFRAAVKAQIIDPETGLRTKRVAIAVGVVVTLVALRIWRHNR
jgi:hypothetical protein